MDERKYFLCRVSRLGQGLEPGGVGKPLRHECESAYLKRL
jgi:hypothetical protein